MSFQTFNNAIWRRSRCSRPVRRNRDRRRGTAALEFALVGPLVIMFFFGAVELGRGVMLIHLLNNAARSGCRSGVVEGTSTTSIQSAANSALAGEGISGATVTVLVNDGTADASTAQAGDEITVRVSVTASSATWLPFAKYVSGTTAITGQYTLNRE
jgi:Flp pilus assembly protein TadG